MSVKSIHLLFFALASLLIAPQIMAEDKPEKPPVPEYVSLGDPMVLNLATDGKRLTFLQLKADVLVNDDDAKTAIEVHLPAIRHQLIVILSEQPAIDMKTPAKREQLRQQITEQVREMMGKMADNKNVQEVLFSTFLVQ